MANIPTRAELIDFITTKNPHPDKREIARIFHVKGDDRVALKIILQQLKKEGLYRQEKFRKLSSVLWLEVLGLDKDGHLQARPLKNSEDNIPPIYIDTQKSAPPKGAHILARMQFVKTHYRAIVMRIETKASANLPGIIGMIEEDEFGYFFTSIDRKARFHCGFPDAIIAEKSLSPGDIVRLKLKKTPTRENPEPNITHNIASITRIVHQSEPHALSLLTLARHNIESEFPKEVQDQAESLQPASLVANNQHRDLTDLPFVTMDGADAKDFDDAVYAEIPENKAENAILYVAIADVSYYVLPNCAIDLEAKRRGNSIYLPDKVVPMLPEKLSNNLCSLRAGELRPVMVARISIDQYGNLGDCDFFRAFIKSVARLTYEQAEEYLNLSVANVENKFLKSHITALESIYVRLKNKRDKRGAIDLERSEYKIAFNADFVPIAVTQQTRLTSHKMIEEMMIAANVAVANFLQNHHAPCVFRVHESPSPIKAEELRLTAVKFGLKMPKKMGKKPMDYRQLLLRARGQDYYPLLTEATLRAQSQAVYAVENIGHFGLALERYCHFTSPIRRYSDLCVHRALNALLTKKKSQTPTITPELCQKLCETERLAQKCEYDAFDHYGAMLLQHRIGEQTNGSIAHIAQAGLFIHLDDYHIEGFMPARLMLPAYLRYQRERCEAILKSHYKITEKIAVIIHDVQIWRGEITLIAVHNKVKNKSQNLAKKYYSHPKAEQKRSDNSNKPSRKRR